METSGVQVELVSWTSLLLVGWCLGAWLLAFVECLELDLVVACWMVPGYLLLWNAFPVECFCGLWLLPRNVLPLKFLSVDE